MFWFPLSHTHTHTHRQIESVYTQWKISIVVARLRRCLCISFTRLLHHHHNKYILLTTTTAGNGGSSSELFLHLWTQNKRWNRSECVCVCEYRVRMNGGNGGMRWKRRTITKKICAHQLVYRIYRLRVRWKENKYGSLSYTLIQVKFACASPVKCIHNTTSTPYEIHMVCSFSLFTKFCCKNPYRIHTTICVRWFRSIKC